MTTPKKEIFIEGMNCNSCAQGITNAVRQIGLPDAEASFANSNLSFSPSTQISLAQVISKVESLGYKAFAEKPEKKSIGTYEIKVAIAVFFTLPLMLAMFFPNSFLHNPLVQLGLCLPVYILGLLHFGKSAWGGLKSRFLHMDVLIVIGSSAAFFYSLWGTLMQLGHNYMFYETAAGIITLILIGNLMEHRSVKRTAAAIEEISKMQPTTALRVTIANDTSVESVNEIEYESIQLGDILQANSGDRIAADGEVISGQALLDESMMSGESLPLNKTPGSKVTSGTIITDGSLRFKVEACGQNSTVARIIDLIKNVQLSKPNIQRLGDQVSAVFVPIVLVISTMTLLLGTLAFGLSFQTALLNSVAVLLIACPCAMGLATPTAVMVGIGRAAKSGILIRAGSTLEQFANVKTIVFDKTGTLTTGKFRIKSINCFGLPEEQLKAVVLGLEKHSSHPIAQSICKELSETIPKLFSEVSEIKGVGIEAKDQEGNLYQAGSYALANSVSNDSSHAIYILKNRELIGTIDIEDEIRTEAAQTVSELSQKNIKLIILSGDSKHKNANIASKLGISEVHSEKRPDQKLALIENWSLQSSTAMVGDGINDAAALQKATVGISLGNASALAIQSAQIILLNDKLSSIVLALDLSKLTLRTIKQNLFWAFFYNILAIPLAACGYLTPLLATVAMAGSDLFVIGNSLRLRYRKV